MADELLRLQDDGCPHSGEPPPEPVGTAPLRLDNVTPLGHNRHGYTFVVGRVGARWVGAVIGGGGLFVFPQVSEGFELGLTDRAKAVRMTTAVAADLGSAYGGVDEWLVPEAERGHPSEYRCGLCEEIGCQGECRDEFLWGEEYP